MSDAILWFTKPDHDDIEDDFYYDDKSSIVTIGTIVINYLKIIKYN